MLERKEFRARERRHRVTLFNIYNGPHLQSKALDDYIFSIMFDLL